MHRPHLIFLVVLGLGTVPAAQSPRTRAEATDYRETSRCADVLAFLEAVTAGAEDLRLFTLGRSAAGHPIPAVLAAPPSLQDPPRAHAAGRVVVYLQGNIHAGEVEGKEALQMLLREIRAGRHPRWRERLVLLVVPVYNVDGNDRISPRHRPEQKGPPGGVGLRPNGQNLDLNRDYLKAEAPETRAALRLFRRWDPHLFVDLHTTNGSRHRYPLTYAPCNHPNADPELRRFTREVLLAEVRAELAPRYPLFPYGNFRDRRHPARGWATFGWEGRYGTNYYGLRNRLAVLSEAYAYRPFRERVAVTLAFVTALLDRVAAHADEIRRLTRAADRRATAHRRHGVAFQRVQEGTATLRTYAGETPRDLPGVPLFTAHAPTETVALPAAVLFPAGLRRVARLLVTHGIRVERLRRKTTLLVEVYRLEELQAAPRLFQGHRLQAARVSRRPEERSFPPGTFVVSLRQPLARLAAELLVPEGRDGLLAWGFLDAWLTRQWSRARVDLPLWGALAPVAAPTESWP